MIENTSGIFHPDQIARAGRTYAASLRLEGVLPQNPEDADRWSRQDRTEFLRNFIKQAVPQNRVKNFVLSQEPISGDTDFGIQPHRAIVYLQPGAYFPAVAMQALTFHFGVHNPFSFRFICRGYPFPERNYRPHGVEGL
jgi:hypothetical protein